MPNEEKADGCTIRGGNAARSTLRRLASRAALLIVNVFALVSAAALPPSLCVADASGGWRCSTETSPPARARIGAPVPAFDTRLPQRQPRPSVIDVPAYPSATAAGGNAGRASRNAAASAVREAAREPARPKVRILEQPRSAWALQLIATGSHASLEKVAEQHRLYDRPAVRLASGDEVRYALIWDVYPDRASAEAALAALPKPLQVLRPWVRPVGPLQDAMTRATRISPPAGAGAR